MKTLLLPQTCELGPSSRYRVYQLVPLLQKLGITCEVSPAIDTALYGQLYLAGRGSRRAALAAIWRRRRQDILRARDFDVVFLQKGFLPGLYAGLEARLPRPYVLDFDDAIWLPRQGGSRLLRALHRESAVQRLLRGAAAVTAGNQFLAEYAGRFNRNVTVVPTAVDVARYAVPPATAATEVNIGWIGSRTTLPYLKLLKPVFENLRLRPRVIASGDPSDLGFDVDFRPWRLETELDELSQIGIGIAPLPDTPWERGKCGVKVLQYMACGIPVVASPVGVHNEILIHGVNGFLAKTQADWTRCLRQLLDEPALRQRLGLAGRQTVAKHYDVSLAAARVAKVLEASAQTSGISGRL